MCLKRPSGIERIWDFIVRRWCAICVCVHCTLNAEKAFFSNAWPPTQGIPTQLQSQLNKIECNWTQFRCWCAIFVFVLSWTWKRHSCSFATSLNCANHCVCVRSGPRKGILLVWFHAWPPTHKAWDSHTEVKVKMLKVKNVTKKEKYISLKVKRKVCFHAWPPTAHTQCLGFPHRQKWKHLE